jgi:hypothetical protein
VMYCTSLNCTVQYCILRCYVLYCIVLHCVVLYCAARRLLGTLLNCTYGTVLKCTSLHCFVLIYLLCFCMIVPHYAVRTVLYKASSYIDMPITYIHTVFTYQWRLSLPIN